MQPGLSLCWLSAVDRLHRRADREIEEPVPKPSLQAQLRVLRNELHGAGIMRVQVLDDDARLRDRGASVVVSFS